MAILRMDLAGARHVQVAALVLLATAGCASTREPPAPAIADAGPAAGSPSPAQQAQPVPGPIGAPVLSSPAGTRPERIEIPAIGVDATMTELGIADDGAIEVPADPDQAGWLDTTPAPGQQGPSVVAGHVDSTSGPAVFAQLGSLPSGAAILITRRDGSTVRFTVDGVRTYRQDHFPTEQVYGPVPGPVLRLITCGGDYERSRGGYQSNVVVYAS